MTTQAIQWPIMGDSLQQYLNEVRRIPLLEPQQERELALRVHRNNDLDAARILILSHLRFVVHIALSYRGYGLALSDLIQEGNVGLMKAVKRFNPEQNVRLVSFAVHWIRAEIHEFILKNWRIVKIATTKAQRKLFFKMKSLRDRLGWISRDEAEAIAGELGVSPRDVIEMESRLYAQDVSFDISDQDEEDSPTLAPVQYLATNNGGYEYLRANEENQRLEQISAALNSLDERSKDIVRRRWLEEPKATLHDLAAEYGVSAERIRQIEAAAFKRLRSLLPAPE